jgi:hypothetical protein
MDRDDTNMQNASTWDDQVRQIEPFTKLKDLTLHNFPPVNDKEIEFIMAKFTDLEKISVTSNCTKWVQDVSKFQFLQLPTKDSCLSFFCNAGTF